MEELKWPVDKCEHCGSDLTAVAPKARDKTGFSDDGLKTRMWTDYCPKCGMGYQVGNVQVPKKEEVHEEKVATENVAAEVAVSESGAIRQPQQGQYFCTKCASNHNETSGIGKRHLKYKEA